MPHIRKSILQLKAANSRLVAAVFTAILILVAYFVANSYYNSLARSKAEVLERLKAITFTAVWLIDGDDHDSLANNLMVRDAISENNQNRIYSTLHNTLKVVHQTNHLKSPLYTLVYYAKDSTFHFIGTSSDEPYYRHSYKNFPKDLLKNYLTGGTLDSYQDENGHWLSAFAPLKNSKGEVVALLEADENFESFLANAKNELTKNTLVSIAILLPFGLMLFRYLSKTLRKQEQDQATLVHQKEEIEAQNEEIKTQSNFIEKQNHELELRVSERTMELETANTELSNFLYHSSHDVQAPIATLKGLYTLANQVTKEEATKIYLKLIYETTSKLDRMVKTIQLVHHIKTLKPKVESIELVEMIHSIFNSLPKAENYQSLEIEIGNDINLKTDKILLATALEELLKNSIQYNASDTELLIKVVALQNMESVKIFIQDNGVGLSTEAKKDLFQMFKRGNERSIGIGLGLYIAQKSLGRVGAKIKLIDTKDKGASFCLSFPS